MTSPQSLARASSRHPWLMVGSWLVAIVLAVVVSSALLGDALTTDLIRPSDPLPREAKKGA